MDAVSAAQPVRQPITWRWGALLAFALIGPVGLPAGGADRRLPEVRRRSLGEPLLSTGRLALQAAPQQHAPALVHVAADTPLRVLRSWRGRHGERWLQVEAEARRGWLVSA